MKYIEIHDWKEYKKKKDWLKATELLQDEMAYNMLLAHNKYSDVKYDENSEVDRDVVYIHNRYGHDSNKRKIRKMEKIYEFSLELTIWRIEYECCLINEDKLYDERDQLFCMENTIKLKKKLIKILRSVE